MSPRGLGALALACAMVLSACQSSDVRTIDLAADAAMAAEAALETPARDALLTPALWVQAAAWVDRENQAGRPVVINLFASWCGPCRAEAPLLREAIAAHPDVAFLLVDHLDKAEEGMAFLVDEGLDHVPSLFDDLADIAGALQARGMPATAFFTADGKLVGVVNGVLTEPVLAQRLADLEATIPGN